MCKTKRLTLCTELKCTKGEIFLTVKHQISKPRKSQTLEPFLKTINVGIADISYFWAMSCKIASSALKNCNSNTTEQAYNEPISND